MEKTDLLLNVGHGSIHDGILIAMRKIAGTTYDKDTNLAYVKPGGEWNDVIGALDAYGVAVVGGRLGMFRGTKLSYITLGG